MNYLGEIYAVKLTRARKNRFQQPPPRDISDIETYVPGYLAVPHVRRLAMFAVSGQGKRDALLN